jgi:hypothetical protein
MSFFFLKLVVIIGQNAVKRTAAAIMLKPTLLLSGKLPVFVKRLLLFFALLLLFSAEILRVYFVMPFPGSQVRDTVSYAYWLDHSIVWIRILVLVPAGFALVAVFKNGRIWAKILLPLTLASYVVLFALSISGCRRIRSFISRCINPLVRRVIVTWTDQN